MDQRREAAIAFKGNPMTLVGPELTVGQAAPAFEAVNNALETVKLDDFKGKVVLISVVPSIDTGVCEMQTKRFNQEADKLDATVLTISLDLPFAQKRFCGAEGVDNNILLSDYRDRQFGKDYGVFIEELCLLARAVFVVDGDGKLAYLEIVGEATDHPDYDKALAAAKSAGA